jgi:hypothetical protein
MRFLNNLIRIILFIAWALLVYNGFKLLGFEYNPESTSMIRNILRVLMVVIIFGGGYFLLKINFIGRKNNQDKAG